MKTHAYALMGTHYHFSIQVKSLNDILNHISSLPNGQRTVIMNNLVNNLNSEDDLLNKLIINQFQNFQNSYAKSINKQLGRHGSLFQKKFKRSIFNPEIKFRYLQYYIHHNARKHGLVKNFKEHRFISYHEIINGSSEFIDLEGVMNHFQDLDAFKKFHHTIHFEEVFKNIDIENIF
ncbi:MAG: hypothetical protein HKN68_15690 [Saprospiraceae bacterium]|nr:hypothetical protein [Saprospiraceae bacterium]